MTTPARIVRWRKANPERHRKTIVSYRKSPKGIVAHLWKNAKVRAGSKGLPFTLTKAAIARKLLKGTCELTGIQFEQSVTGRHPFTPSIDRVDYKKGYSDGNIRLVIFAINAARGDWGDEVLRQVCEAYMKHVTR